MKKIFLTLILLLSFVNLFSQDNQQKPNRKYVAWVSPSKATHVYGFMFNFWPKDEDSTRNIYPKIYGAELSLNFIGIFTPFIALIHQLDSNTRQPPSELKDSINFKNFKRVNGIQAGLLNMEPTVINGIDVNATGSFQSKTNGLTVSAIMNSHYVMNGITIAAIGNYDTQCTGVQIGLINSCKKLKGFQIGLWNKNQKRSLPIINWCFVRTAH